MPQPIRIVVCLDVDAATPAEAYKTITTMLSKLCAENPGFDWESSDEWYGPDGELLSDEEVTEAREIVFPAPATQVTK